MGDVNVTELVLEFVIVAVHQILYLRDIYPKDVFSSAKQYGVPVKMSRHPDINQYIHDSMLKAKTWIENGEVSKIVVHIEDKENKALERFVFELQIMKKYLQQQDNIEEIERRFADFLSRIAITNLKNVPKDCKFSIVIYTKTQDFDTAWMLAEQEEIKQPPPRIIPLKTIQSNDTIALQLFVEENISRKKIWEEYQ